MYTKDYYKITFKKQECRFSFGFNENTYQCRNTAIDLKSFTIKSTHQYQLQT